MQTIRTNMKRGMSLLLALSLTLLPIGNLTIVHAEEEAKTEAETVIAEDLVKDISDTDFDGKTSLEGIGYEPDRETVTLMEIKDMDGNEVSPDAPGNYVATYLVTPKDQSEPYQISRNIVLTDTEGLAHTPEDGARQKTDTESEDDTDSEPKPEHETLPVPETDAGCEEDETGSELDRIEKADVQLEEARTTPEAIMEQVENGEALMLTSGVGAARGETAHLVKGEDLYYPSYLGNYMTCYFTVNGKTAYCLESHKATPVTGDYVAEVLDSNGNLQKALYYGYGGAGDLSEGYLSGKDWKTRYIYTHIAASYAYAGTNAFAGCSYENLVSAGVIAYIDFLFGQEAPPKGELSFSSESVTAKRDGEKQKTSEITLKGDHRNYITIQPPTGVTVINKTKNTSATGGNLQIYGGDTFYFTAPLSHYGSWETGNLYGSIRETWRTLVLTTGGNNQDIGVFESESASPVKFKVNWVSLARVELTKKDSKTGNPLQGAEYGIYKDNGCSDLLLTLSVTDEKGKAVSDYFDSSIQTVYVKERKAPEGYQKNETVYPVTVSAGKTVQVEVKDDFVTGKIVIQKVDAETGQFLSQGDSVLAGAVYGLYAKEDISHPDKKTGVLYPKGTLIAQKTVGKDGTLVFDNLFLGKMYVKEITPPTGYMLDTTEYDATLTYEGEEKPVVKRNLTVREQVMKQAFELIKISEDGEQTETELVEGAGFSIYLISSLSKVKDGSLKPGNGKTFAASDFRNYDFSGEEVAVLYQDGQAVPVPELFTDKKGYAKSPELPYGSYVVVETTVPEHLKAVAPFVVEITKDSREPQIWRVFDDRPYQFLLKIVKKDAQTKETVLGKSASYQIYDCEKEEYVKQVVYYPKKEVIDTFKTNAEGYLLTPEKLPCGTYRIEEVKAPEGFVRNGYEENLTVEGDVIPKLTVSKTGIYEKAGKPPIEITVDSDTPCEIDPDTGVPVVTVEQFNDEQVGSITIEKLGEQLVGVKEASLFSKAKAAFQNLKALVSDKPEETNRVERQLVYEETGVTGAEFSITAGEDIVSPDGAVDESGNPIIRYRKGDQVAMVVTKDGKAGVHNLPLGTYEVREETAGEHFILNGEVKVVTLTETDDTAAVVYEGITLKNERQKISISVEKKDSLSEEPLEGVVFGLYARDDIRSMQGEVLIEAETLLEKQATDADGKLTFASDLTHGNYMVKELEQKPGYLPNPEVWEVEIPYENQTEPVIRKELAVANEPTITKLKKTDLVTGKPVIGAKVEIRDLDGTVVEAWETTEEEHIVYALPEGEYVFHEELPPYQDGYVTAKDVPFVVKEDGKVTKVEMQDDISKVEISKTDLTTGEELVGATLQILNKEGEVLHEWVSDGIAHKVERLPVGEELILRETIAPKGYVISEDVPFTLKDTGELQKVEMKDAYVYGKVRIEKTDEETGNALSGAVFEIRNQTTGKVEATMTTDETGVAESPKLLLGTYTKEGIHELFAYECVEVKAPDGYELPDTVYPVSFQLGDGKESVITVTLAVTNHPVETPDTPQTGDTTPVFVWIGLLGTAALLLFWILKQRKK